MTYLEPGWYRDPDDPKSHRYWDGSSWIDARPVVAPTADDVSDADDDSASSS